MGTAPQKMGHICSFPIMDVPLDEALNKFVFSLLCLCLATPGLISSHQLLSLQLSECFFLKEFLIKLIEVRVTLVDDFAEAPVPTFQGIGCARLICESTRVAAPNLWLEERFNPPQCNSISSGACVSAWAILTSNTP